MTLPPVRKVGEAHYVPRDAVLSFAEVAARRSALLRDAARDFVPDVVVVDHAPAGLKGELREAIALLRGRARPPRFVLSLRDVVDGAALVRELWTRDRVYELLDELYDAIVVYGCREFYDIVEEYALPPRVARKTHHVGYLGRDPSMSPLPAPDWARPRVLVMAGGGEDGLHLFRIAIEGLDGSRRCGVLVVGGPLLPAADRARLHALAGASGPLVRVVDEVPDALGLVYAADVVVSMAGFNSVCEIFASARPAVIVPRAVRSYEQQTRAAFLDQHRLIRRVLWEELTPERLRDEVLGLLDGRRQLAPPPPLHGLTGFADVLAGLADSP